MLSIAPQMYHVLLRLLSLYVYAFDEDLWAFAQTCLFAVAVITRDFIISIFDWLGWTGWQFANSDISRHSTIHDRLSQVWHRRILEIIYVGRLAKIKLACHIINLCWINHRACITLIAVAEPATLHKVLFIFILTVRQTIVVLKFISYKIILLNGISFVKYLNWLFIRCSLMTWDQFWFYRIILWMFNTPNYRWRNLIQR